MTLPEPRSRWIDTAPGPDRSGAALPKDADVVVVGAGIAGLTTAYRLVQSGRRVLVLDAGIVAGGVSGHTTAKVSAQHGLVYDRLRRRKGAAAAAAYAAAQVEAMEWIEAEAEAHDIDCQWQRLPSYLYTGDDGQREQLAAEADAAAEAGLPAEYLTSVDLPFPVAGAVRFDRQAQFHPRRWLLALAESIERAGGKLIEQVRVTGVQESERRVVTDRGQVRAEEIVIATHYPILDRGGFFARLEPERDLVVSGPVDPARAPEGTYLATDVSRSVRTVPRDDGGLDLIVGGENYRTGSRVDVQERYRTLARWASEHFGVEQITHRWSAHDLITPDTVPYVGRYHPGASHLWVATGFKLWGMSNGTAAGLLLAELVQDRVDQERAALFDPVRTALDQVPGVVKDNVVVGAHLVGDLARAAATDGDLATLQPGQARVGRVGKDLVAAYRDDDGAVHAVQANCTHMGCVIAFNNAEKTWDCPCHSSRFELDGTVRHGPAVKPLRQFAPSSVGGEGAAAPEQP